MSDHTTDKTLHREAPLVHLILTDLKTLSGVELEEHLRQLREMRAQPATTRAKTERKPRAKSATSVNLGSML